MKPVVVLHSGGLDSSVLLWHMKRQGRRVEAVWFDYGQKHGERERRASVEVCRYLDLVRHEVRLPYAFFSGSALTSERVGVPEGHYTDASMAATVVPNRNMVMLSLAGALAAKIGGDVAYAAHAGDHTIYPDCREESAEALSLALWLCAGVRLLRPFVTWTKREIAAWGREGVPLELTWSCYVGGEEHCGRCGTCVERLEALA